MPDDPSIRSLTDRLVHDHNLPEPIARLINDTEPAAATALTHLVDLHGPDVIAGLVRAITSEHRGPTLGGTVEGTGHWVLDDLERPDNPLGADANWPALRGPDGGAWTSWLNLKELDGLRRQLAAGARAWPYTTPEGHTYQTPTTYKELCALHDNAAQAYVESWDPAEHPPEPTWEMVGLAHKEIARLRAWPPPTIDLDQTSGWLEIDGLPASGKREVGPWWCIERLPVHGPGAGKFLVHDHERSPSGRFKIESGPNPKTDPAALPRGRDLHRFELYDALGETIATGVTNVYDDRPLDYYKDRGAVHIHHLPMPAPPKKAGFLKRLARRMRPRTHPFHR